MSFDGLSSFRVGLLAGFFCLAATSHAQQGDQRDQSVARGFDEPALTVSDSGEANVTVAAPSAVPELPAHYQQKLALTRTPVNEIRLEGNSVLSPEEVGETLSGYVGRMLSLEEIQLAANAVTRLYVDRGFVNSGVVVPDQEIQGGVVTMSAVEGTLGDLRLRGNKHLRDGYIMSRLRFDQSRALNVFDLEQSLRLLQEMPMIEKVDASVLPGSRRGESILDLNVAERRPMTLSIGYSNHRSPSVDEHQGVLSFTHSSLTGNGDYLLANYAATEGLDDYSVTYGFPLNARDLTIEGYYAEGDSNIVAAPFNGLDIVSESENWGLRLYQPLLNTLSHYVTVGIGFEHNKTESFLLGDRFSFSPGEDNGRSEVSQLKLTADWTWRRDAQAVAIRGSIAQGVSWLDSTDNGSINMINGQAVDDLPDSDFRVYGLQANYARLLPFWGAQLLARVTVQQADRPLLSSQKIAIGGSRTVRGYRENLLVRDNGLVSSVEVRVPLFPDENNQSRYGLTVIPFFDYGVAEDEEIDLSGFRNPDEDEIKSVGLGLSWNWWKPLFIEVFYAEDLDDVRGTGNSLQEDGWHIQAYYQWQF